MGQRYRRSGLARDNVSSLPGCRMNRSDSPSGDTNSDENRVGGFAAPAFVFCSRLDLYAERGRGFAH